MLTLVALVCAASPFESIAESTRVALAESTLPGFVSAHHHPGTGWTAVLEGPFGATATCVQAPASSVVCTRSQSHEAVAFPALGDFFARIAAPNDARVSIEVASKPEPHALLAFGDRETAEHRLVLLREGLVVTGPLPPVTVMGSTAPVVEVVRWPLLVLAYTEGGNGNNASGSVSYRLVQVIEDGPHVSFGTTLSLGGGSWGRAVTDEGFLIRSRVDVACPTFESPFVSTRRVCEGDVDPRSAPSFTSLCARATPCLRARTAHTPRTGRWSVRASSLVAVSGPVRRDDGAVRISEIADVHALNLSEVELINTSAAAQDVSGAMLGSSDDVLGVTLGACVLSPGEAVVVSRDLGRADCRLDDGQLTLPSTLVLRRANREISRATISLGDEEVPEFEEPPSWQVDAEGRGCVARPTLGRSNSKCPRRR